MGQHCDTGKLQYASRCHGITGPDDLVVPLYYEDIAPKDVKYCRDHLGKHGHPRNLELDQESLGQVKLSEEDSSNNHRPRVLARIASDFRVLADHQEDLLAE
jgi:hypothetical protein